MRITRRETKAFRYEVSGYSIGFCSCEGVKMQSDSLIKNLRKKFSINPKKEFLDRTSFPKKIVGEGFWLSFFLKRSGR